MVPSSTFYRHRERYFNVVTQRWQKCDEITAADASLSDSSDETESGKTQNSMLCVFDSTAALLLP